MSSLHKNKKDVITSAILIAFALLAYFWLIPQYVLESGGLGMSPRFFPNIGVLIIGCLGLIMLFSALHNKEKTASSTASESSRTLIRPIGVLVVLIAFNSMFENISYFVNAPAMIIALMLIFGQRNAAIIAGVAVLIPSLLFLAFNYGLNLPLS